MKQEQLNQKLAEYDSKFFGSLEIVLEKIAQKSKALASNLKECVIRLQNSDRHLRAAQGEEIAIKDSDLSGDEFEIFRKYVRLLRSCTIMCGHEISNEYKKLFIDFFSGTRLKLSRECPHGGGPQGDIHGTCKNKKKETT